MLEQSGFTAILATPEDLPTPGDLARAHREWRCQVVAAGAECGYEISHGIAAKLINVYLKVRFVCGGHHAHERVHALHPPIDSLLLESLYKLNVGGLRAEWAAPRAWRWSKFTSENYECVIDLIKHAVGDAPLWSIEEHWVGHR